MNYTNMIHTILSIQLQLQLKGIHSSIFSTLHSILDKNLREVNTTLRIIITHLKKEDDQRILQNKR